MTATIASSTVRSGEGVLSTRNQVGHTSSGLVSSSSVRSSPVSRRRKRCPPSLSVTTTAPNFVRGSVVLLTSAFQAMRPEVGIRASAMIVGAVALAVAYVSLWGLDESYGKDLDYLELP